MKWLDDVRRFPPVEVSEKPSLIGMWISACWFVMRGCWFVFSLPMIGIFLGVSWLRRNVVISRGWINLISGTACVALLLSLGIPAVLRARESARHVQCKNNLKQWGVALHNYHDAHQYFPPYAGGTTENGERLSGRVMLINYLNSNRVWFEIRRMKGQGGDPMTLRVPSMPPENPVFLCPSSDIPPQVDGQSHASYVFCAGDQLDFRDEEGNGDGVANFPNRERTRGGFGWRHCIRKRDITDGASYTLAIAERDLGQRNVPRDLRGRVAAVTATSPADCVALVSQGKYQSTVQILPELMGERWASGHPFYSVFLTAVPPNGPSCAASAPPGGPSVGGWFTASSRHPNGVNVLLFDGGTRFINETINTGDLRTTKPRPKIPIPPPMPGNMFREHWQPFRTESSYGIWGMLGTIDAFEDIYCSG